MVPAGGCNVRFVAYAAEREPDVVVGKPSRDLALLLSSLYGLSPDTTLMVGDRINTDVAFGLSVGWHTMLVLSGCHSRADIRRANAAERPDYCADTVADLANLL